LADNLQIDQILFYYYDRNFEVMGIGTLQTSVDKFILGKGLSLYFYDWPQQGYILLKQKSIGPYTAIVEE